MSEILSSTSNFWTFKPKVDPEVLAEICEDGSRCSGNKHCCTIGCCYGDDDHMDDDRRYTYGYRLSIWNMWYFWFVILFLMMSCFGGCGYYKHRQRLIGGEPMRGQRNFFSILAQPYNSHREGRRVLTPQSGGYPETMGYVYGRHPDANLAAPMAPPPYTEVMNNPGLFPPSTKLAFPDDMDTGNIPLNEPSNQMPQPPPYTEVANQNGSDFRTANQNGSDFRTANQNVQNESATANQSSEGNQ